jgi:hypothetical protein
MIKIKCTKFCHYFIKFEINYASDVFLHYFRCYLFVHLYVSIIYSW